MNILLCILNHWNFVLFIWFQPCYHDLLLFVSPTLVFVVYLFYSIEIIVNELISRIDNDENKKRLTDWKLINGHSIIWYHCAIKISIVITYQHNQKHIVTVPYQIINALISFIDIYLICWSFWCGKILIKNNYKITLSVLSNLVTGVLSRRDKLS